MIFADGPNSISNKTIVCDFYLLKETGCQLILTVKIIIAVITADISAIITTRNPGCIVTLSYRNPGLETQP